jgi:hypothetical protein
MVHFTSLWLPILLSAAAVFVASSIIHMFLPYHKSDYTKVPSEGAVMDALRRFNIPPGDYMMPRPDSTAHMKDPAFIDSLNKGPVAMMTVMPNGPMSTGMSMGLWFVYCLVISFIAAHAAGAILPEGSEYLKVWHTVALTAFAAYGMGSWPNSIWYRRKWSTTIKSTIDGLIYAVLTAGIIASMWPK